MRVARASVALARRQAAWIVAIEPWRGLGDSAAGLRRWLGRKAGQGQVRVAVERDEVRGVIVTQPEVLLGHFIALVAVLPAAAGQGIGRMLVEEAATRAARRVRWLYTSSDADNRAAARFYRKLGFVRVGRLPGLVRVGRMEILWRRPSELSGQSARSPGKPAR